VRNQENLFASDSSKKRPPVIIEKIGIFDPAENKTFASPSVGNIDPRSGEWKIQLSANMLYPDSEPTLDGARIRDIKLHLRLSAIVDKSPEQWADLWW
jgi:hypothetical protein